MNKLNYFVPVFKYIFIIAALFLISILLVSCEKETFDNNDNTKGEINFSFKMPESTLNSLKNADSIADVSFVTVTITDITGKNVIDFLTFDLLKMNGEYISKPIALPSGQYSITDFLISDKDKNVIYATPKSISKLAYLVKQPLPIDFVVQKDVVLELAPEVLKVESSPADFGYLTFRFIPVETINVLMCVFVYDESLKNFISTTANLTLTSDSSVRKISLDNKTNTITIKTDAKSYKIEIDKEGYKTWEQTYSVDELKNINGPLMVILEKFELSWSNFFGTKDNEFGYDIIQTSDGGALMVGSTNNFNLSVDRMYLVKTNSKGEKEWEKFFDEVSTGKNIISTSDGGYVIYCGVNFSEISLMKIDSIGNKQWLKSYKNGNLIFTRQESFTSTADGGFLLSGNYMTNTTEKSLLIKTDKEGNEIWRTIVEDLSRGVFPAAIKETADGNIYLLFKKRKTGELLSTIICLSMFDNNGRMQWIREYPNKIAQYAIDFTITNNNILILGTEGISGNTSSPSILLLSADLNGSISWEKRYKSFGNKNYMGARANAICSSYDGNYFITGTTNLEQDIYVIKIDEQGNTKYEKTFGGINYFVSEHSESFNGQDAATNITATKDGGCLVTGWTSNFGHGGHDAFILKLDNNGNSIFGYDR